MLTEIIIDWPSTLSELIKNFLRRPFILAFADKERVVATKVTSDVHVKM